MIIRVLYPKGICQEETPQSIICWMEESTSRASSNRKGWSYARQTKFLAMCSHPQCNIIADIRAPDNTKISSLLQFTGMSCVEIACSVEWKDIFALFEREGNKYFRTKPTHPITKDVLNGLKGVIMLEGSLEDLLMSWSPCGVVVWLYGITLGVASLISGRGWIQ